MIYLDLFLTFLKIGAVSFGGGYAMIPIISENVTSKGWISGETLTNFIAVAESTPGPIAVNLATFVGSSQGGIVGAIVATIGVVLPAFLIILLIAIALRNILKYAGVNAFLDGVRPAIVALIFGTAITMGMTVLLSVSSYKDNPMVSFRGIGIFLILGLVNFAYNKLTKKKISAILLIVISAGLGVIIF